MPTSSDPIAPAVTSGFVLELSLKILSLSFKYAFPLFSLGTKSVFKTFN